MQGLTSARDVAMVIEIASVASIEYWLGYFSATGTGKVPVTYGCTAVMAPEAFPFPEIGTDHRTSERSHRGGRVRRP
jgi:hypothetical protein